MKTLFSWCIAIGLAAVVTTASALPGTFSIQQIYSNADGTVQFVVIFDRGQNDCDSGEALWAGQTLVSMGPGPQKSFVFPTDLPTCETSGRHILIATEGFAALGLVSPDYVIPNGFLQKPDGTVFFANVSQVTYTALPNDGAKSIRADGTPIQNLATNFAGQSASVTAAAAPAAITPVAGVWWDPNQSGSGYGLDYQNGVLIVQVYSYLAGGAAQWYLGAGNVTNNVFTATLDKYTGGQCVSCAYKAPALAGNDGTIAITFTSPTTADVALPGGGTAHVQRYFLSGGAQPVSAPVAGVWWDPNQSGSGYGLDYQNGVLIVQVYSYLAGGAAQWYLGAGNVTNNVFTATLDKYTGGQCVSCAYKAPALAGNDGTIAITFTSATTATVDVPGGGHFQIQRFFQP